MNSLAPPTNPTEAYHAQLAALIQLGIPMVSRYPDDVSLTLGLKSSLIGVESALLALQVQMLKEEVDHEA